MRSTRQFSITVPNEMADMVEARVASGMYPTESEVFRAGLRALDAQEHAIEAWLRDQVVPALVAVKADPGRVISAEDVLVRLLRPGGR